LFKTALIFLDFTVFVLGFFFNGRGKEEEVLEVLDEIDVGGRAAFLFFLFALGCGAGGCG